MYVSFSTVNCPIGTFFNVVSQECSSCSVGTYQPDEGILTCLVCPTNTSTTSNNSKSVNQCKGNIPQHPDEENRRCCEQILLTQDRGDFLKSVGGGGGGGLQIQNAGMDVNFP